LAEGSSIFQHSGHIGAATLASVRTHSSSDAANFRKLARKAFMISPILQRPRSAIRGFHVFLTLRGVQGNRNFSPC
jgi:hypothetical protein